ncbi:MAG: Eco57I restriction-modification methylase domain-containing protein [Actinomycetota bacterium]
MILSNPFSQKEFTDFINGFLPEFKLDLRKVEVGSSGFSEVLRLGESAPLMTSVLIVRSTKGVNSRISLTNNSFRILKAHSIYRALIVYVNDDDSIWRLSLLTALPTFDSSGKVVINYSNPRRHSYVLGSDVGIATARKYLANMGPITDFENLQFRFSVEVVNKDFYKEIAEHFYELVGRYGDHKEVLKKPLIKLPGKKTKMEDLQNYSVRLLGRIIFLWFLKQKTSNNGKPLLPTDLLTKKDGNYKNILHERVEPLFFEVLNKLIAQRDSIFQQDSYGQVPYLNGGLFHASDGDAGDFYNEKLKKSKIDIPDNWFIALFKTLDTYNFTIDENLENDLDLSIDPEMLGRVFENLLAEINPETGQIARKSTGSYYTPRAIVNFMVDETLAEYLITKTSISDEKIRAVITTTKHDDLEYPLDSSEKTKIVTAISDLQVLDPACGSGAFPMGMLQKLLWVITQVDPDGDEYLESQDMEGTEHWLTPGRLDYLRKRKIIRDVIFGTDIQSVAVEIAKLRCFLTLIVDQEIDDESLNRGVVPLPNLDFKFICADSLTPLDSNKQMSLGDNPDLEKKLASIRRRYFTTTNEDRKNKLRGDFVNLVTSDPTLFAESLRNTQLKSFRPLVSNNQAKFFDLHTMFGIDGFPIIIGNPPYKVLEGPDSKEILENLREIKSYTYSLGGKLNLYRHFIERSQQLLTNDGVFSFIVPSTLIADKNTQGIRQMFRDKGSLKFVIEFPEKEKVFESVTQATTVFLFQKGTISPSFKLSVGLNKAILPPESSAIISWEEVTNLFGDSLTFPLVKSEVELEIFKHLFNSSHPLTSFAKCYKGDINLGYFKDKLRNLASTNILVRGDHISNYSVDLSESRTDRRWIEMATPVPASKNSRIVCQNVANMGLKQRLVAGIVPPNVVVADSANCIDITDESISKEEMLAIINSKLLNWYFKRTSTNNHVNIYELENLPIRAFPKEVGIKVKQLVSEMIQLNSESKPITSVIERGIAIQNSLEEIIFDLYGIDSTQADLIESEISS